MTSPPLPSRRDFLKLSGLGALGLLAPGLPLGTLSDSFPEGLSGRVTSRTLWVYDRPSFNANRIKMYWRDLVLPITNVTVNEDDPEAHNRVWYEVGAHQYAYSGVLQPVRTVLNHPTSNIPPEGALAEVTVPFTDAFTKPDPASKFGYAFIVIRFMGEVAVKSPVTAGLVRDLDDGGRCSATPPATTRLTPGPSWRRYRRKYERRSASKSTWTSVQWPEYDTPIHPRGTRAVLRVGTCIPHGSATCPTPRHSAGTSPQQLRPARCAWVMFTESRISLHGTAAITAAHATAA
jgi:hypothetical protein